MTDVDVLPFDTSWLSEPTTGVHQFGGGSSFGYRPKRTAHEAIKRVAEAIVQRKTRVLDFDLRAYFDNVRHDRLLETVGQRVDYAGGMESPKVLIQASG